MRSIFHPPTLRRGEGDVPKSGHHPGSGRSGLPVERRVLEEQRRRLEEERDVLLRDGRLGELEIDLSAAANRALGEIEHALDRIRLRIYWRCEGCGAEIPLERLRAMPRASCCVDCQVRREQHGLRR